MRSTTVFMAALAVSVAAGCPSSRQHNQYSYESPGVAPIVPTQAAVVTDVDDPCVPAQVPQPKVTTEVLQPKVIPVVTAPKPVDQPPGSLGDYGHDKEYNWLIGRLQRVHVRGGEWKIRYAPLDEIDQWGGSMVLAPDIRLEEFSDGELIYVEGEILVERPSLYLAGPLYRIRTVRPATLHDRRRFAQERSVDVDVR